MPKMKSHSGAAKRFRVTGKGKIKRKQAGMRHILTKKSTSTKRKLRKGSYISGSDVLKVERMLCLG
ncbi:MAG: 50S ribosomal protein L35 [Fibrobacterales bacterium]